MLAELPSLRIGWRRRRCGGAIVNPSSHFLGNRQMASSFLENFELPHKTFSREGHPDAILSSCGLFVNSGHVRQCRCRAREFPDADISKLLSLLGQVPEFRARRGREHDLGFILAVCVVATLAGAKNYREIATVASAICQCQLMTMGARWDSFRDRYRCPRRTLIWEVLTNVDAAELDRITGKWLLAQARKENRGRRRNRVVIAIDGKVQGPGPVSRPSIWLIREDIRDLQSV